MFLQQLFLRQFRNFEKLDLDLGPGLNLFVGPNGSGKSNILEAVSVLTTAQSHRGAEPKTMVQWNKDGLAVKGDFGGEEELLTIEVRQKPGRPRQVSINGHAQKRLRDSVGKAPLVSFAPDDLSMVKGEPSLRRRTLNAILCQTDADYFETLQRYAKVTSERNAALKRVQDGADRAMLEPWTAPLLKDGLALTLARKDFVTVFAERVREEHRRLSGGKEEARLVYKPSLELRPEGVEASFAAGRERLLRIREGEIALGSTLIGPHRDDVAFTLNEADARDFASQGQQRTLALAVKLAEHRYLTEKLGRAPICLFDDVLSELDPARRDNLVDWLSDGFQCLVSLTALTDFPEAAPALKSGEARVFHVSAGEVKVEENVGR